jgi:hypothetical protein
VHDDLRKGWGGVRCQKIPPNAQRVSVCS